MINVRKVFFFLFFLLINSLLIKAQQFQLFTEDFENTVDFTLNSTGPSASMGNNKWIVNNNYTGTPTYQNTMSQDSTYSGNITFAPNSKYLHIYDSGSGITNANYDATNQSDNFASITNGFCTLGMDSLHFIFFYLSEGSSDAYGEVYYSIDNGAWVKIGQSKYNSKSKWQYEDITDPVFKNHLNLRFGFRWVNGNGTPPSNTSFSIDDVNIVGSYGSAVPNPVNIVVDSVTPHPVCQGNFLYIYWHLTDTLCDGAYTIQLSTATGTFPGSNAWIFNIYYPQTSGVISVQLPTTVPAGSCYKIRINKTTPLPAITGIASPCFAVIVCPNTITTLQPVVTYDTNAVCIGSAIDIPFWSTGVFSFNTYTAQLSNADGTFPASPTEINSMFNSNTYSPVLPPYTPGTVSGIVPTVTPGCNYYIRVISDNGVAIGSVWGPFCIQQCDIETNNNTDLSFCVTSCVPGDLGNNKNIPVEINSFTSTATYPYGNIFKSQLMSSKTFAQIGTNGILGSVTAFHDTIMKIHVPCKDSLPISPPYGIPLGMNYMRVVSTKTSQPDSALGTLIRVTIGATSAVGPTISTLDYANGFVAKDTFCTGDQIYPVFYPYNYYDYSTYTWAISFYNGGNPFQNPQGANSNNTGFVFSGFAPGTYTLKVQETNNGCVGKWSLLKTIVIVGPPNVNITGPPIICQGDTAHYTIPAQAVVTSGMWTSSNGNGVLINSTNTETDAIGVNPGTFVLKINALNSCGAAAKTKVITVKAYPTITKQNDTTICSTEPLTLSTTQTSGYTYSWKNGGTTISTSNTATVSPTNNTTYMLTVSNSGCNKSDTVNVFVENPTAKNDTSKLCPLVESITLTADTTGNYLWSTGETTQQIVVNDTGIYTVSIKTPGKACARTITYDINLGECPQTPVLVLPNVFTPNGDGNNDSFIPMDSLKGRFDKFDVKIYNRWGQLLYETTDQQSFFSAGWDGKTKNGTLASDGVYYYIAETSYNGEENKPQTGFFSLFRGK